LFLLLEKSSTFAEALLLELTGRQLKQYRGHLPKVSLWEGSWHCLQTKLNTLSKISLSCCLTVYSLTVTFLEFLVFSPLAFRLVPTIFISHFMQDIFDGLPESLKAQRAKYKALAEYCLSQIQSIDKLLDNLGVEVLEPVTPEWQDRLSKLAQIDRLTDEDEGEGDYQEAEEEIDSQIDKIDLKVNPNMKAVKSHESLKLMPPYQGMTFVEAIKSLLSSQPQQVFQKDFIFVSLFGKVHEANLNVAVTRLTSAINYGRRQGYWYKVPNQNNCYQIVS
jgi:hypothetical protein